jgi:hypothetical protein
MAEPGPRTRDYPEGFDTVALREARALLDELALFGIRERTGFLDLLRLMLRQSGGLE